MRAIVMKGDSTTDDIKRRKEEGYRVVVLNREDRRKLSKANQKLTTKARIEARAKAVRSHR